MQHGREVVLATDRAPIIERPPILRREELPQAVTSSIERKSRQIHAVDGACLNLPSACSSQRPWPRRELPLLLLLLPRRLLGRRRRRPAKGCPVCRFRRHRLRGLAMPSTAFARCAAAATLCRVEHQTPRARYAGTTPKGRTVPRHREAVGGPRGSRVKEGWQSCRGRGRGRERYSGSEKRGHGGGCI